MWDKEPEYIKNHYNSLQEYKQPNRIIKKI